MSSSHYKKLSEIVDVLESGSRPKGGVSIDSGDIPSLGAEHLNDEGGFNFSKIKKIENIYYEKMRNGKIKYGDILIVKDGATTGKVSFVDHDFPFKKAAVNEHVFILRVNNKISSSKYVFHFLRSPKGKDEILSDFRGATVGGISRGFLDKVNVPLSSLAEQQRIVSILDKAELIKRRREFTIEKLDSLAASIFLETYKESSNTLEVPLDEVVVEVKNCNPASMFGKSSFTYIDIGAVNNLSKAIASPQVINGIDAPSRARQIILDGDVLVSTVRPNLNCVALVDEGYINPVASTGFCVLRCNHEKILPEFLFLLVRSQNFIQNLVNQATGASYPAVSDKIIKSSKVNLPSIELQKEFAKKIKKISQQKYKLITQNTELNKLLDSLQSEAFSGML